METKSRTAETESEPPPYWKYMFESDKKPTKQLHMLLTAVAKHISENIGDHKDKKLSPNKLAAFYKAVGGNYDSLFVDVPHPSISYIYQSIGCQHTLQPTTNDFEAPSIPALTTRGFIRWESIETLLQPDEHVPYLQFAVEHFNLKNPETGELYPTILPAEVFPLHPDAELERWHTECGQRLKKQATPEETSREAREDNHNSRPDLPPRPNLRHAYTHVRPGVPGSGRVPRDREDNADYFSSRPVFQHVPRGAPSARARGHGPGPGPGLNRSATTARRTHLAPEEDSPRSRARRRSVPENYFPTSPISPTDTPPQPSMNENLRPPPENLRPPPPENHTRRHSHPRQYTQRRPSTSSSSSSSTDDDDVASSRSASPQTTPAPRARKGPSSGHPSPAVNNLRFKVPDSPIPSRARAATGGATPVPTVKVDPRMASYSIPVDSRGKPLHPEDMLPRSGSRTSPNGVRWREDRGSRRPSAENFRDLDERDRDKVRRDDFRTVRDAEGRPRPPNNIRSGSHDGRYGVRESDVRRDRRDDRFRDRAGDRESYTDREDRGREREEVEKKKPKRKWW